jgi:hypothetical protein
VINVERLKEGVYFLYLLNVDTNISSTKKIVISK